MTLDKKQKNVRAEAIWTKLKKKKKRKIFLLRSLEIKESNQPLPYVISSSEEHRTSQTPEKQAQMQILPVPKQMSQK